MAKYDIVKGATSVIARVFFQDSSQTNGAGLTGLTSSSSGLVCYRARDDDGNAGGTAISLSAGTRGTWSSGGFVEKDSTNMPGWYEFGIPNSALAAGSRSVGIHFKGATNLAPCPMEIELTGTDNQDSVRGGMTALPNAAANANGGLPILSSSGTTLAYTISTLTTYTGNTLQTGDAYGQLNTLIPHAFTYDSNNLPKVDIVDCNGTTITSSSGIPAVNTTQFSGQTIVCGASVTVEPYVGSTGAAINGSNVNTLSSHDPGAMLGTSTLTQAQVTGGAYALNSPSFVFNSGLDFTSTQKISLGTAVGTAQTGDTYALANGANGFVAIKSDTAAIVAIVTPGQTNFQAYANAIADSSRRRSQAHVEGSSYGDALSINSHYGQIQQCQRSDTTATSGKLTVYETTGSTLSTFTLTVGSASPVTAIGP